MEERMRFVVRLLDGEPMSGLCREFGISRKTGYKIFDRYQHHGLEALSDRSRRRAQSCHRCGPRRETGVDAGGAADGRARREYIRPRR